MTAVVVNGEQRALRGGSLASALEELGYPDTRGMAVAVNGDVVPRSTWGDVKVADGDQIEILTIAQGG